jgi:hypothetical protein
VAWRGVAWRGVEWIDLTQNMAEWRDFVKTAINLWVA